MEKIILFSVTETEADLIYKALGELPAKVSINLMNKLQKQFIESIDAINTSDKGDEEPDKKD